MSVKVYLALHLIVILALLILGISMSGESRKAALLASGAALVGLIGFLRGYRR